MINIRRSLKNFFVKKGYYTEPDFMIAGVQKGGTTFLYSILKYHPQVTEPGFKEAHFFDNRKQFDKGISFYRSMFQPSFMSKRGNTTFDATPDYIYYRDVPDRIKIFYPNMKFIFILRDPVERAFSAWKMHHFSFFDNSKYRQLYDNRSFTAAIKDEFDGKLDWTGPYSYLTRGIYATQLMRFANLFGWHNILILESKSLRDDLTNVLNRITSFLDIDAMHSISHLTKKPGFWVNETSKKKIHLEENLRNRMEDYYRPYDLELKKLLGYETYWMR